MASVLLGEHFKHVAVLQSGFRRVKEIYAVWVHSYSCAKNCCPHGQIQNLPEVEQQALELHEQEITVSICPMLAHCGQGRGNFLLVQIEHFMKKAKEKRKQEARDKRSVNYDSDNDDVSSSVDDGSSAKDSLSRNSGPGTAKTRSVRSGRRSSQQSVTSDAGSQKESSGKAFW